MVPDLKGPIIFIQAKMSTGEGGGGIAHKKFLLCDLYRDFNKYHFVVKLGLGQMSKGHNEFSIWSYDITFIVFLSVLNCTPAPEVIWYAKLRPNAASCIEGTSEGAAAMSH